MGAPVHGDTAAPYRTTAGLPRRGGHALSDTVRRAESRLAVGGRLGRTPSVPGLCDTAPAIARAATGCAGMHTATDVRDAVLHRSLESVAQQAASRYLVRCGE